VDPTPDSAHPPALAEPSPADGRAVTVGRGLLLVAYGAAVGALSLGFIGFAHGAWCYFQIDRPDFFDSLAPGAGAVIGAFVGLFLGAAGGGIRVIVLVGRERG
jgi:hypothetical protein